MVRQFNFDYFNIWKEVPLMCAFLARRLLRRAPHGATGTLIVNPCLIGEFAASAPAIADYIARHPSERVDIVVSPPLREMAEHLRGRGRVYTAASVFARRHWEAHGGEESLPAAYGKIIVMRMSPAVYRLLSDVRSVHAETALCHFTTYGTYLLYCTLIGRTPKTWRMFNFDVLRGTDAYAPFTQIFDAPAEERSQTVLLHTSASWAMNRWPREHWADVAERLHARGIALTWIGSPRDSADYDAISARLSFHLPKHQGLTLWELTLLIARSRALIGVDSGPRNIAHLTDTPSVTLLGPGPHMFTPPNPCDIVIDKSGGRGIIERFVERQTGLIHRIMPQEVATAFEALKARSL